MDFLPDYLWFLIVGTLAAALSAQLKFSTKANAVAVAGLIVSVGLLGYGVYLYTQEPEPCGGLDSLEGARLEKMACVSRYLQKETIPFK